MREIAETIFSVFEKGYDLKKTVRQTNRSSGWNGTPVVRFNQSKKSNTVLERGVTTETRWRGALHLYSRSRFFLTYYVDHVLRIFAHFSFDSRRGGEEGKKKEKRRRKKKKKKKNVSSTVGKKSWDLSNPYPPSKMTTCEKLVTTRDNTFITTRIADCRLFSIPGEKKREDFNRWAQRTIPSDVDHQSHAEAAVSNCPPPSHRHPPSSDSTSVYVRVLCAVFFSRVDDKPIGGYK